MPQCTGISKYSGGGQCGLQAEDGYPTCIHHAEEPERLEKQRQRHVENGKLGGAAYKARNEERKAAAMATPPDLGSQAALLARLGDAWNLVTTSSGAPAQRSGAMTKIVEVAHKILQSDLENRAKRIDELLETHPDLVRALSVVK